MVFRLIIFSLLLNCFAYAQVREFGAPQRVVIEGLPLGANKTTISTEEPFISRDGQFLFFNTHEKENQRDLHYAQLVDNTWQYRGELGPNINTPKEVEGNPSMDKDNNFYFIDSKLEHMIQSGRFNPASQKITGLKEVTSVPKKDVRFFSQKIIGNMGVEVSADGNTVFFDRAVWGLRLFYLGTIRESDINFMTKNSTGWKYNEQQVKKIMNNINTAKIEYAESLSNDMLEIFFTRLDQKNITPKDLRSVIMRSSRKSINDAFGVPQIVTAIGEKNFVEAPCLSPDEKDLYYHQLIPSEEKFRIFKVSR